MHFLFEATVMPRVMEQDSGAVHGRPDRTPATSKYFELPALNIARLARNNYPQLIIHVRACNRHHAWRLQELGMNVVVRETFSASPELSQEVLVGLVYATDSASQAARTFRDFDARLFEESYQYRNDNAQLPESDQATMEEEREEDNSGPR